MSPKTAISSALQLICVTLFFLTGLFFIGLPHLPHLQLRVVDIFSAPYETCSRIGIAILAASLLLGISFYFFNKGHFMVIKMGGHSAVNLHTKVVWKAVEECLKARFAKKIHLKDVLIGPKSYLELVVGFSKQGELLEEELYVQVEEELNLLLKQRFGYSKPFYLNVKK